MINENSLKAIEVSSYSKKFIKPNNSYNLALLPETILYLLTGKSSKKILPENCFASINPERYDKIILFLIDGFGWRFIEKYSKRIGFLKHAEKNGIISKLTSQFPSTTACNVTTIHTNQHAGKSGIYEWFQYEPSVDSVIVPLKFCYARNQQADNLMQQNLNPLEMFPSPTIYETLASHGIQSFTFQHAEYTESIYSNSMLKGSKVTGYKNLDEGLLTLKNYLNEHQGKGYYLFYYDRIDAAGHVYGPNSKEFEIETEIFFEKMQSFFNEIPQNSKTLLLTTADHGQTEVDPATTLYLNLEFPEIIQWIKRSKTNEILGPYGSCRDLFLHIKEENFQEAYAFLKKNLQETAVIIPTIDLIENGYFGKNCTAKFKNRIGNIAILPYPSQAVWWYEKDIFQQKLYGHHGGLTPAELETHLISFTI